MLATLSIFTPTEAPSYPWGDDENQTNDPSMSFMNFAWDGKRGLMGDTYKEYVPAQRLVELQAAANAMRDGIEAVRGQDYVSKQSFLLWDGGFPTSGASEDWAFSRQFISPKGGKLAGFVIEFNKEIDFFPTWSEMSEIIADVDAGFVSLCSFARPSFLQVLLCKSLAPFLPRFGGVSDFFWAIWHRVFPPELWGPYGPWSRAIRIAEDAGAWIQGAIGSRRRRGR